MIEPFLSTVRNQAAYFYENYESGHLSEIVDRMYQSPTDLRAAQARCRNLFKDLQGNFDPRTGKILIPLTLKQALEKRAFKAAEKKVITNLYERPDVVKRPHLFEQILRKQFGLGLDSSWYPWEPYHYPKNPSTVLRQLTKVFCLRFKNELVAQFYFDVEAFGDLYYSAFCRGDAEFRNQQCVVRDVSRLICSAVLPWECSCGIRGHRDIKKIQMNVQRAFKEVKTDFESRNPDCVMNFSNDQLEELEQTRSSFLVSRRGRPKMNHNKRRCRRCGLSNRSSA